MLRLLGVNRRRQVLAQARFPRLHPHTRCWWVVLFGEGFSGNVLGGLQSPCACCKDRRMGIRAQKMKVGDVPSVGPPARESLYTQALKPSVREKHQRNQHCSRLRPGLALVVRVTGSPGGIQARVLGYRPTCIVCVRCRIFLMRTNECHRLGFHQVLDWRWCCRCS
ncbi:hypothetical protein H4582DRAFT_1413538 [Lactarius indigo]|nr:hypothetical protein H4582DRAFT_1413538 [Lactarius indigo]